MLIDLNKTLLILLVDVMDKNDLSRTELANQV